jgi:hypothetical protein
MPDLRERCGTGKSAEDTAPADALVLFGAMGDLAHKKIFPALYHMVRQVTPTLNPAEIELHRAISFGYGYGHKRFAYIAAVVPRLHNRVIGSRR